VSIRARGRIVASADAFLSSRPVNGDGYPERIFMKIRIILLVILLAVSILVFLAIVFSGGVSPV
jgi:hypothetical protein